MKPYLVALTGASGVLYGVRLVKVLLEQSRRVAVVLSDTARIVVREELGVTLAGTTRAEHLVPLFGPALCHFGEVYGPKDFTAPIASGSYPTQGMVIVPCSMSTLGAIASGAGQNLIHRAADCTLKEGRKLIVVPRETPLHLGQLENMASLARMGASVVPAMPGFYAETRSLEDLVDFMVGRILDQLGISHTLYPRWTGLAPRSGRSSEASVPGGTAPS